jgi:transcriptional regulator with XRE-family HTH domain
MTASTLKNKINLSHAKALRRSRELLKVTRHELGHRLGLSLKAIEKYESGRAIIDEKKLQNVLEALNLNHGDYEKIRRGKGIGLKKKQKTVHSNQERRSYRRVITKEVRVLKILRQMKSLTQDQASSICGYSRPSVGHIENGRIEIPMERIRHIVASYGYQFSKFEELMKEEVLRDEIIESCSQKLISLPEDKLKIVQSVLANF